MVLPLLSNTATYGLWWQETNQMIGIINNLTDGQLIVNGSILFTNSQFSLTSPSQNISNTLALTLPSGNSLFLLSSNGVVNGTMYLTGAGSGLAVSNNANINQNLYVSANSYSGNSIVYQTTIANNLIANTITVATEIVTVNLITTYANTTNHNTTNLSSVNINVQTANITEGLGVTGGLTTDFANVNYLTSNNVVQLYGSPSINAAAQISATLFNGTGIAQFRAVQSSSGIIFRNDGNVFSILTTGNVANPYTASYTSAVPFQFNVSTGALLLDATGLGVTFGGPLLMNGIAQHANNLIVTGSVQANGAATGLYVANSSFLNGSVIANNQFTVQQSSFYNGSMFVNNGLNVTGQAIFVSPVLIQSTFTILQGSTFLGPVTVSNSFNVSSLFTASASQIGIISSIGEIQSTASVTTSSLPYGQFRAVQGNYGVIFRNDGTNMSFLQTPSTTSPTASTWNSFRPFSWNLISGAVIIDGGGSGITTGGPLTVAGSLVGSSLTIAGAASVGTLTISSGSLSVSGALTVGGTLSAGATTINGSLNAGTTILSNTLSVSSTLNVGGLLTASGGIVSSGSEIQSYGSVGNQFRAIQGNFGVILRNDGTNVFLMQTASTSTPATATFNAFRPFYWNLASGAVSIDGTGNGTSFGGGINVGGSVTGSSLTIAGAASVGSLTITGGGSLSVAGAFNVGGALTAGSLTASAATITGLVNCSSFGTSGSATIDDNLGVGGTFGVTGSTALSSLVVSGAVTAQNNLNVEGGFGVVGGATFESGVGVGGNLGVTGQLQVSGQTILGILDLTGVLNITGNALDTTGGYYFNQTTSVIALDPGSVAFEYSIYAPNGHALCYGFHTISDKRLKHDINTISLEEGKKFVLSSNPVTYKTRGQCGAGFIAQEQVKAGYSQYVGSAPHENLEETIDEDGLVSVKDVGLSLKYDNYIAYLTAFAKWSVEKIDKLEQRIIELEGKI